MATGWLYDPAYSGWLYLKELRDGRGKQSKHFLLVQPAENQRRGAGILLKGRDKAAGVMKAGKRADLTYGQVRTAHQKFFCFFQPEVRQPGIDGAAEKPVEQPGKILGRNIQFFRQAPDGEFLAVRCFDFFYCRLYIAQIKRIVAKVSIIAEPADVKKEGVAVHGQLERIKGAGLIKMDDAVNPFLKGEFLAGVYADKGFRPQNLRNLRF